MDYDCLCFLYKDYSLIKCFVSFKVDIENFLSHHPDHRLPRIKELALALSEKKILPTSAVQDAERLDARWRDLSQKAKLRTTILEGQPLKTYHFKNLSMSWDTL